MSKNRSSDSQDVQLITFGKRDPTASIDRRHNAVANENWQQSALYKNGVYDTSTMSERERFLPPVKLDPGWDSVATSNTALTSLSARIQEMEENAPKDRCHLIYTIMLINGIAILIPWNMFINAKSYFEDYKLDAGNQSSEALKDYRTNFMSYVGMASQYPNFMMNLINLFCQCGGKLGVRVVTSILIMVVVFLLTVVLAMMDTSEWPETFFWVTMASAVVINAAVGLYQNSMYGLAAILPMKYTNAIIFGNNISGTLVAVTNIIVLVLAPNQRTSAIYYFVVAVIILLVAFDAYFLTAHSRFYRHYLLLSKLKQQEIKNNEPAYKVLFKSFGRVFSKIWHLLIGIWFVFFITLALFPAVISDVQPLQIKMNKDFWKAIFCFLFFNFFATLGNLTTEFVRWPNARWVNVLVFLRIIFVPLLILGNFRPHLRTLDVYVTHDAAFIATVVLFAFSSGYCSSLLMMYAPKQVSLKDAPVAGMTMALFLVFGILCGINFSRIWGILIGAE